MQEAAVTPDKNPIGYRFGVFELNLETKELRRNGVRVRLAQQPGQLLALLLGQAGNLVTREEIRTRLWPPDTFVDFDNSVNSAVNRIRQVLRDSAENPRYIETLPRLGYRFIAPVEPLYPLAATKLPLPVASRQEETPALMAPVRTGRGKTMERWALWAGAAILLLLVGGAALWHYSHRPHWPQLENYDQITADGRVKTRNIRSVPLLTDGTRIYFSEQRRAGHTLMFTGIEGGTPEPMVALLPDLYFQDISRDGLHILATDRGSHGQLWMLNLPSDDPHIIPGIYARAAAWSPDGKRIVYSWRHQLRMTSVRGLSSRLLCQAGQTPWWIRWRPDGRQLRYTTGNMSAGNGRIWKLSLRRKNAAPRPLTARNINACCGSWTGHGSEYFFQYNDRIHYFPYRIAVMPRGSHQWRDFASGPIEFQAPTPVPGKSKLLVIGKSTMPQLMRYRARLGKFEPYLGGIRALWVASSPNGQSIAYALTGQEGRSVWIARHGNSGARKITFTPFDSEGLAWSPRGDRLVIRGRIGATQPWHLFIYTLANRNLRELPRTGINVGIASWSPHGKRLVYGDLPNPNGDFPHPSGIHIYTLAQGTRTTLSGSQGLWTARWSPNGRWIAALRQRSQRLVIYSIRRRRWRMTPIRQVDNPVWSRRGNELYFDTRGNNLGFFRYSPATGKLHEIVSLNRYGWLVDGWSGLDWHNRPLVTRARGLNEIYRLNWKRR